MQVSKGAGDLVANCTADGYDLKTTRIVSTTQLAGVIGSVIDFGIVDMLTGAMWKYPDQISIAMDKRSGPGNLNKPLGGGSATVDGLTGR